MIDYQYLRQHDYSGIRTAPLCICGHTKGTVCLGLHVAGFLSEEVPLRHGCAFREMAGGVELVNSEFLVSVGHEVAFTVNDDRGALDPLGAVLGNPGAGGPLADVVAARQNTGSLDVADLDDVLVLGEHVAELLAGGAMTHGAVDVLQNLCSVSWSIA